MPPPSRGAGPYTACWPRRAALLRVLADVGAAPGHGEDQSFAAKNVDGSQHGVAADVVFLLELLHGRQWTVAPLALGDPRPEDSGQLQIGRFGCPVINGHMIKLDHRRSDLSTGYLSSALH
jgi:hypothetical protein